MHTLRLKKIAPNDPNSMYGSKDVLASYKMIVAGFGISTLYTIYLFFIGIVWGFNYSVLVAPLLPVIGYASVLLLEAGFGEFKLLKAVFAMQQAKGELASMEQTRHKLQRKVRTLVDKFGPTLEDLWDEDLVAEMREGFEAEKVPELHKQPLSWRHRSYKKLGSYSK